MHGCVKRERKRSYNNSIIIAQNITPLLAVSVSYIAFFLISNAKTRREDNWILQTSRKIYT